MNEMLALAERHVIAGRKIVARQRELVRRLEASGRDAALFASFVEGLDVRGLQQLHRELEKSATRPLGAARSA
jgi:hypothetical protein